MSTSSTPYLPRIETIVALLQPASRGSTHKRGQTRPILSFLSCCAFFLVVLVSLLSSSVSTTVQASGVQFALAGGYVDQPRERSRALFTAHVDLSIAPCAHSLRSVPPLLRSVDPVGLPRCRCLISRPHHIHTAPLTHSLTHTIPARLPLNHVPLRPLPSPSPSPIRCHACVMRHPPNHPEQASNPTRSQRGPTTLAISAAAVRPCR
jgi:hypothetical protein